MVGYDRPMEQQALVSKAYCLRAVTISLAAVASRPEVGSSAKSRDGLETSSTPMLTLLRCPPLHAQPDFLRVCQGSSECLLLFASSSSAYDRLLVDRWQCKTTFESAEDQPRLEKCMCCTARITETEARKMSPLHLLPGQQAPGSFTFLTNCQPAAMLFQILQVHSIL